ncbi:hypothetical protein [Prosthecomicrobium pneumaticum]|uniref:Putative transcriptional regulator n=1 Tax=Prosthecomicrobium pneumaticum TaxID=81895 RepID=A0A7W9CUB1_9HYPH|nr:hypothetical protein [Prosthecomicrobium pneumaticum]MBB5752060.1 putative transcriptional regulator [Prosthecomicrobium pneumaticum]
MPDAPFTFLVDDDLKRAFAEVAAARDRSGPQMLRDFMRDVVDQSRADHDDWFRTEVDRGIQAADTAGAAALSQADVEARWRSRRADLLKPDGD